MRESTCDFIVHGKEAKSRRGTGNMSNSVLDQRQTPRGGANRAWNGATPSSLSIILLDSNHQRRVHASQPRLRWNVLWPNGHTLAGTYLLTTRPHCPPFALLPRPSAVCSSLPSLSQGWDDTHGPRLNNSSISTPSFNYFHRPKKPLALGSCMRKSTTAS